MRLPVLDVLENPDVGLELDRPPQGVDARGPRLGVHLVGETEQRRLHELLGRHLAAGDRPVVVRAGDVAPDELVDDLWQREHRQQRDDVRESLVKRGLVGRRRRHEAAAQSVDEGVRGLVNNDVRIDLSARLMPGSCARTARRRVRGWGIAIDPPIPHPSRHPTGVRAVLDSQFMEIAYDDRGLVAVIVQDWRSGEVLTLAYANAEAVRRTRASGELHLYSRARQEQWHKGATSGNTRRVRARSLLLSGVDIGPLRDALTDAGSDLSFLVGSRDGGGSWL